MPTPPRSDFFSDRLGPLGENALSRALEARRKADLPVLDLTEANPTRAGFSLPEAEILAALAQEGSLRYAPDPLGLLSAREAVARYCLESRHASVDPSQILLTASTSEAYALLFKLLCDPGDAVLIPAPSYPLFQLLSSLESVRALEYPLAWDGEWHLQLSAIEALLKSERRARAILLVSPGNPTGAYLKRDEHARLVELCAARNIALISDEVFADYPTADAPDPRALQTAAIDTGALTFTLSGLSKVCGLPQLKLSWCSVKGPERWVRAAMQRLELIADTFLSVGTPVQLALPALLALRPGIQQQIRERCRKNRIRLLAARAADANWDLLASEGGWCAILQIPAARSDEELVLKVLERGVLVQPGYFYELTRGNFLVLSLLLPEAPFAEACAVLAEVLAERD